MLFDRKLLLDIKSFLKKSDIVVIHGARQTGKTSLLKIIQNELAKEECFYFDLEDSRFRFLFEEGIDYFPGNNKAEAELDSWFETKNASFLLLSDADQAKVTRYLGQIKDLYLEKDDSKLEMDI